MLKRNKGLLAVTSLTVLLPVLLGLALWNRLPEQVAIHWNAAGEVDGWGGKGMAVFTLPLVLLAVHWLCVLVTSADPKNRNIEGKSLLLVLWITPVISVTMCSVVYLNALEIPISVEVILPLLMGVLFVVIGNYLPKCRQNYSIGIKVPWALDDEENWNATHRFAGKVWTVGGLLSVTSAFFGIGVLFAILLVMALAPMLYSYIYYRKHRKE